MTLYRATFMNLNYSPPMKMKLQYIKLKKIEKKKEKKHT